MIQKLVRRGVRLAPVSHFTKSDAKVSVCDGFEGTSFEVFFGSFQNGRLAVVDDRFVC